MADPARELALPAIRDELARQRRRFALLFASSGIEKEIVESAMPIDLGRAGTVPVASAEEAFPASVKVT